MKNSDTLIHSFQPTDYYEGNFKGLTKREYFAAMAMQGILANTNTISNVAYTPGGEVANVSVAYANALLLELEKQK